VLLSSSWVVTQFLLLFDFSCWYLLVWYFPTLPLRKFGSEKLGFTIESFFQIMLVILCYFVNVYLSIYFDEIFLYSKFSICLCSKFNICLLLNLATF
jgi:hypothetical protein